MNELLLAPSGLNHHSVGGHLHDLTYEVHTHKVAVAQLQNRGTVQIFGVPSTLPEMSSVPLFFLARLTNMPSVCSVYTRNIYRAEPEKDRYGTENFGVPCQIFVLL